MTIKDIAKQCSVSVSTVSRVLNDRPDVSDEVRRKVRAAIKDSNYIPNNSARDLVRTKSESIGLVVRGVSNPFYTDIIQAIEKTVTDAGFSLVMQQIPSCGDEVQPTPINAVPCASASTPLCPSPMRKRPSRLWITSTTTDTDALRR